MAGKKIQVHFDDDAVAVLETLKAASGATSTADVIRQALAMYDWALEQSEEGYSVGAMKAGKPVKVLAIFKHANRREGGS